MGGGAAELLRIGAVVKGLLVAGGIEEGMIFGTIEPDLGERGESVVYRHVGSVFDYGKCPGYEGVTATVEVVSWGKSYEGATGLAERVLAAMQEHRGAIAGAEVGEIRVADVSDIYDEHSPGDYGKRLVFSMVL
jgi:hypothetical protein